MFIVIIIISSEVT